MNTPASTAQQILVADDDGNISDLVRMYLTKAGYDVTVARDGDETQRLLRERTFDLVISATNMAGVDGYELVKWLRRGALEANRYLAVILVSGHTPPSQVFKGRDAGANFTIAKPITPKIVLERILWAAKEDRQFIECEAYLGPDRRFENDGPPAGAKGRRREDPPQALRPPGAAAQGGSDAEKVKP